MADHRAEQILSALETTLSNLATTGENVFRGRVHTLNETEIPAIAFYSDSEQPLSEYNDNLIDRLLNVMIEAYVLPTDADPIDTIMNQIRKEVTIKINTDRTLGLSFVIDTYEGEAVYDRDGEAEEAVGVLAMRWSIHYRRSMSDPSA